MNTNKYTVIIIVLSICLAISILANIGQANPSNDKEEQMDDWERSARSLSEDGGEIILNDWTSYRVYKNQAVEYRDGYLYILSPGTVIKVSDVYTITT